MDSHIDSQKQMAMVDIPYKYQTILLNADDAYALFKIMCRAHAMEYDYNLKGYKSQDTSTDRPSMKAFTIADYAQLVLNSEPV